MRRCGGEPAIVPRRSPLCSQTGPVRRCGEDPDVPASFFAAAESSWQASPGLEFHADRAARAGCPLPWGVVGRLRSVGGLDQASVVLLHLPYLSEPTACFAGGSV